MRHDSRNMKAPGWFRDGMSHSERVRLKSRRRKLSLCEDCGRPLKVVDLSPVEARMRCPHCPYERLALRGTETYRVAREGNA